MFRFLALWLLLSALAAPPLQAALTWEKKEVNLIADPDETELKGTFNFKNTGEKPVTITSVHPSCGCTVSELEKKTYEPGESGAIPFTYTYTSSSDEPRVVTILVGTDEADAKSEQLKLQVEVPKLSVSLSPKLLLWRLREKPTPKVVRVTLREDRGFELADFKVEGEGFEATTRPPAEGSTHQHVIVVTPTQTKTPGQATLLVTFNRPDKSPKTYRVRLAVKK